MGTQLFKFILKQKEWCSILNCFHSVNFTEKANQFYRLYNTDYRPASPFNTDDVSPVWLVLQTVSVLVKLRFLLMAFFQLLSFHITAKTGAFLASKDTRGLSSLPSSPPSPSPFLFLSSPPSPPLPRLLFLGEASLLNNRNKQYDCKSFVCGK